MSARSGIRTHHHDTNFRSRLEARWAAFFDLVGWRWTYEPFDADGWIPDFLIHGDGALLVEIGPCIYKSDFSEKASKALAAFPIREGPELIQDPTTDTERLIPQIHPPEHVTLVLGVDPTVLWTNDATRYDFAGYLTDDGAAFGTGDAVWGYCPDCKRLCVTHDYGWYIHRPCGHYTGGDTGLDVEPEELFRLWAKAGNRTQWRPAA
jgi:hypothetical protein